MSRRFGPHLAQTFAPKAPEDFFWVTVGVKIDFTLCVYAQNAQNFIGNSSMHAKQEKYPPPPPNLTARTGPPVAKIFFQNTHICVFKMISVTRGSF